MNLHYLIWKHDRDGLFERIDRFLHIADPFRVKAVLCPFDDCGFGKIEPRYSNQADPVASVHNSRAVASPGRAVVMNRSTWPDTLPRSIGQSKNDDIWFHDLLDGNRQPFYAAEIEVIRALTLTDCHSEQKNLGSVKNDGQ